MYQVTLIKRELFSSRRFALLFTINLTIGLLGFTLLDAFKRDFSRILMAASKTMLTADFEVSARRPLTENELGLVTETLGEHQRVSRKSLYSMAVSASNQSLSQVVAISDGYPMYGHITLQKKGQVKSEDTFQLLGKRRTWIDKTLSLQLGIGIGDEIKLGKQTFIVDDLIESESAMRWQGSSLAPRLYLRLDSLEKTNLIRKGSIVRYSYLYKLQAKNQNFQELESTLNKKLTAPQIRIKSHIKSGQDNGRMLRYLSDYLSLVALTSLALAGLGSSYLFRSFLSLKRKDIAILISLGLSHNQAIFLYITKLAILGIFASLLSYLLSASILPLLGEAIKDLTPLAFTPAVSFETLLFTLALAVFYAIFICLPVIVQIKTIKPSALFQEEVDDYQPLAKRTILSLIPAFVGFYIMAVTQSNSIVVGSVFCGSFIIITALFSLLGFALIRLSKRLSPQKTSFRLALRYIQRKQTEVMMGFLALSLGSTLLGLIPNIRQGIEQEIKSPEGQETRSLFMFDIQEEQKAPLYNLIEEYGVTPVMSPMVRARLIAVNGTPFVKNDQEGMTRESEESNRMRNRAVNLSYRSELAPSESIIKGRQYSLSNKRQEKPFEITIEQRYASRLGLGVGDLLTFEIQSIPIEAKIVGLRKVKWNSFDPNFFIQFQPGILEDAPKTFVAAVPSLGNDHKFELQKDLVKSFPNISIIDVTKLLQKVLEIINQMSLILFLMAILAIIAGFVVLFSIANHQAQLRQNDTNLLKILGLSFREIQKTIILEFSLISGAAAFFGIFCSIGLAFLVDYFLFTKTYQLANLKTPLTLFTGVIIISLLSAYIATNQRLKKKPKLHLD